MLTFFFVSLLFSQPTEKGENKQFLLKWTSIRSRTWLHRCMSERKMRPLYSQCYQLIASHNMNVHIVNTIRLWLAISRYVTDATAAMFIVVLTFLWPDEMPDLCCFRGGCGVKKAKHRKPLITWDSVVHKVPWGLILLLGGGFALADAISVRIWRSWPLLSFIILIHITLKHWSWITN